LTMKYKNSMNVNIIATDGTFNSSNYIQVLIQVANMDDNLLEFGADEYTATVDENHEPGSLNISISAMDLDDPQANIEYSIDDPVPFDVVQINTDTIFITNTEAFNFEAGQEWFIFTITAHSQNSTLVQNGTQTTLKVIINDMNE